MKNWIFVFLITLATNAHAVEVNVKCHGDEIIFATDKKTNALKGAYICSKLVSVPVAIIKDENYDNKLDMQDSISFYISKDFTAYKKILVKKFDNFEQDFNDYLQSSGEKDAYYKIDFENLYDSEEIKTIFKRVQLSSTESKTETLNNLNPNDYDENELSQRKRMYDPQNGRFLTEDPKGFAGGDPNLYRYVHDNPLKFTDPFGLSEKDVTRITNSFNSTVNNMTNSGQRTNPGWWNNMNRWTFDRSGGSVGSKYKSCFEQADTVQSDLSSQQYDDTWSFLQVGSNTPHLESQSSFGFNLFPHYWIEGYSSNPKDPVLTIDPYNNIINSK